MSEIISLNIGQCGVKLGSKSWELYCIEHGINPNGEKEIDTTINQDAGEIAGFNSFFNETELGVYQPRSLMIDLEPTTVDEIRYGTYRKFFDPGQIISGKEDAANLYARGYFTVGNEVLDQTLDRIRKETEKCDKFQGFMGFHSVGGGTGSGFTSLLFERLSEEYERKSKLSFSIYPFPKISNTITEPYNTVLATKSLLEHTDATVVLENEAIYDICRRNLDIEQPRYLNMNSLTSVVISSITTSMRFSGYLIDNLYSFQDALIPFHRMHFLMTFYNSISNIESCHYSFSVAEITSDTFAYSSLLAKVYPKYGKYLACCVMYKGDVIPRDVSAALALIKTNRTIRFVDCLDTGFNCSINYQPVTVFPGGDIYKSIRAVTMLANSTSVDEIFNKNCHKFDLMYEKKAFVHWYMKEGMEEGEMVEAREELAVLEKDYEEISADLEEREEVRGILAL